MDYLFGLSDFINYKEIKNINKGVDLFREIKGNKGNKEKFERYDCSDEDFMNMPD